MQEYTIPKHLELNTAGVAGVYSQKVHLTKNSQAVNKSVIMEIMNQDCRHQYGDIIIPDSYDENEHLIKARVLSVGPHAKKENLAVGAVVLYDKLSAWSNPPIKEGVIVITNIENVICIVEDES